MPSHTTDNEYVFQLSLTSSTTRNGTAEGLPGELLAGILAAHFPGHPVMPGSCMVQIAERLAEKATGRRLQLTAIRSAKFLSPVSPDTTGEVEYVLSHVTTDGDTVAFRVTVRSHDNINAKMSLTCKTLKKT